MTIAAHAAAYADAPCYCGHTRGDHRRPGSTMTGRCTRCTDGHMFAKPELHARVVRETAARADPNHVHGPTHTAYACPGFVPFEVCDGCGQTPSA